MFTLFGKSGGTSRRNFLRLGAFGAGLSLADILRARANQSSSPPSNKSVIMIYLSGGPSHLDMFDPKPNASQIAQHQFNNRAYSDNTGKTSVSRDGVASVARTASPEVISSSNNSGGGGGDGGAGGGAGGSGGDESGGGGEDDPPPIPPAGNLLVWLFQIVTYLLALVYSGLLATLRHICQTCIRPVWLLRFIWDQVPDLVRMIRLFRVVFPDSIRNRLYIPATNALMREIVQSRSCEWDISLGCRCWEWFWWRFRFCYIVFQCLLAWMREFT